MKKPVVLNFIVDLKVYPFDVMVSIGQDDDQLGAVLDKLHLSKEDIQNCQYANDAARGRSVMFDTGQSFIRIRKLPETSEEFGTLAHKIFHVVSFVMHRVGMKLEVMVSDEAYAYLIGYLTTEIYKKTNKYY